MASSCPSCYYASPISVPRYLELDLRKLSVPFRSESQWQLNRASLRSNSFFTPRKSPSGLRALCHRESKVTVVTSKSWDQMVLKSQIPVLVEFHASWCGPCKMVHRVIDEIAMEYSGKLKCLVIHADNDAGVAENYDIKVVPVVLLFKNGEKRETVVGTMPKEFYTAAIERVLLP